VETWDRRSWQQILHKYSQKEAVKRKGKGVGGITMKELMTE
jgi:hypothetical protein